MAEITEQTMDAAMVAFWDCPENKHAVTENRMVDFEAGVRAALLAVLPKRKLRIYLCGPINGCTDAECILWREMVKQLRPTQYEFLDPIRRDYRGREMEPGVAEAIVRDDLDDCLYCDAAIVNHPRPSSGTDMEMFQLHRHLQKPVVTILPQDAVVSPWVLVHSTVVVHSVREALEWIDAHLPRW